MSSVDVPPVPYKTPLSDSNGLLTVPWLAWYRQLLSRVGGNSANLLDNPMTGIGDLIYGGTSGLPTRLSGDLSNTRKFLRQLSITGIPTPPVWDTLSALDIPALAYVTSVAMTVPSILSISGTPITSSGTLAITLATQSANRVFAGPTSGLAATPAFRALVSGDIPSLPASIITSGQLSVANGGTGIASGTSGGILAFTASGTLASSGVLTQNQLVIGGGAGVAPSSLGSLGTTTTVLHGNAAGVPSFGAVVLTTDVSGVLPIANGGSGAATASAATYFGGPYSGGAAAPSFKAFQAPVTQTLVGSGTFTPTTGALWMEVFVQAGGGGGGATGTTPGAASAGGNSTFSTITANGGAAAPSQPSYHQVGGAGGTATGGTLNITGGNGGGNSSTVASPGGSGGNSHLGFGGPGMPIDTGHDTTTGNSATGFGGGGGGPANNGVSVNGSGGGGGGFSYHVMASASVSYAVGAAGAGGTAGTGGGAGGAGTIGTIVVIEHFQ